MKRRSYSAAFAVVLAAFAAAPAAQAADQCVNPAGAGGCLTTVNAAITAANAGDTVTVAAGTYTEQVDVNKAVTLVGAGAGQTIIASPALLTLFFTTAAANYPVVFIHPASGVATVRSLTVDGLGNGNANVRFTGIGVDSADATISDVAVTGIRNTPFSGAQNGTGIIGYNGSGTHAVSVTNSTISDFQKNGLRFEGTGLTGTATGNTVTGQGIPSNIAENGILLLSGAAGVVSGNTISNLLCDATPACSSNLYSATDTQSAGILAFGNAQPTTISNNTVRTSDVGIWALNGGAVTGNTLRGDRYAGINVTGPFNYALTGNSISGSNNGVSVSTYSGDPSAPVVTLTGNTLTGNTNGVELYSDDVTLMPTLTARFNRIAGNGTTGIHNLAGGPLDTIENWWGCNTGPGTAGCDTVSGGGLITTAPRLVLGLAASPTSIQTGGQTSALTASLTKDSAGATPAGNAFPATPISFSTTLGSVTSPTSTNAGAASSTLTSGATPGSATVGAGLDGQIVTTSVAITAAPPASGPPSPGGGPLVTAPAVTAFSLSPTTFRVSARATATIAKKAPQGSSFRFRLSRAAVVRISISGIRNGRISGGKCLVTAKKKGKRCTLRQLQGTLSRSGVAGSNRVAFSGRIGALPLPKGRYVATIVAADAGLNSTSRSASFSIVK